MPARPATTSARASALLTGLGLAASAVLTACGSASPAPATTASAASEQAPVTEAADATPEPVVTAEPAPAPEPVVTAAGIIDALIAAGMPITGVVAQDEATDPNNLLGRPGQYTERISFDLPGGDTAGEVGHVSRGGVVERWATQGDAQARADYIQAVLKDAPILGAEYDYVHGATLLRLTGAVLPSDAAQLETALAAIA